jgi:hypothetical protein
MKTYTLLRSFGLWRARSASHGHRSVSVAIDRERSPGQMGLSLGGSSFGQTCCSLLQTLTGMLVARLVWPKILARVYRFRETDL